jgi:hypothetical protein
MKFSKIAEKLDFDVKDVESITFLGRLYRTIKLEGIEDWSNLNMNIEMFREPTQVWLGMKDGSQKQLRPHTLGIDRERLLNDKDYLETLRYNW